MTLLIDPVPELLVEALRGERARRPARDATTAAGLRAMLEDHVFEMWGADRRDTALRVNSAAVRRGAPSREIADAPLGRARGVAISVLLRLLVAGVHVEDPYDDALSAWRGERAHDTLLTLVDHLDPDQRARLRADVTAHFATLSSHLGTIPSSWWPRTSQRARISMGAGAVLLNDVVDLVVGSIHSRFASVALVDITTSPLGADSERIMRFHALVHTLRTSVVPLRTCMFSTATGELWSLDVDVELLMRAMGDLVDTLITLGATT